MAQPTPKQTLKRKHDEIEELETAVSQTNLNGLISSPMITVIAGNEKRIFAVHEYVIKNGSTALAALVSDRWKEGRDKVIDWSGIESSVIVSVIYYLYNKTYDAAGKISESHGITLRNKDSQERVETKTSEYGKTTQSSTKLVSEHHVKVYALADRYLLDKLKDLAVTNFTMSLKALQNSTKELVRIAEFVYENQDLLVTEETPIHVILSAYLVERMIHSKVDSKALRPVFSRFSSLRVNLSLDIVERCKTIHAINQKYEEDLTACKSHVASLFVSCENGLCGANNSVKGRHFFDPKKILYCSCGLPLDFAFKKKSATYIQKTL